MNEQQNSHPQLRNAWHALLRPFAVDETVADAVFADLAHQYEGKSRYYHTLAHIATMLDVVDRLADYAQNLAAIKLAVWFHDVVYEIGRSDNEERSAEYAVAALRRLGLPETLIDRVVELILVTRAHDAPPGDVDAHIIIDADFASFAAPEEAFRGQGKALRAEFAAVPEETFQRGRIQLLQSFLDRDTLFLTPQMRAAAEAQARRNIRREIDRLRNQEW